MTTPQLSETERARRRMARRQRHLLMKRRRQRAVRILVGVILVAILATFLLWNPLEWTYPWQKSPSVTMNPADSTSMEGNAPNRGPSDGSEGAAAAGQEEASSESEEGKSVSENETPESSASPVKKPEATATVLALGDVMHHLPQLQTLDVEGGYDFTPEFSYAKELMSSTDLTIANFESTTIDEKEPAGYPRFNTPSEVMDALKEAGVDILTTANNHGLDTGIKGVMTTLQAIKKADMLAVGSQFPGTDDRLIVDANGISIGFLSYSTFYNGIEQSLSEDQIATYLNRLDKDKVKEDIEALRAEGAEFIIVYPHMGIEYGEVSREQEKTQRQMIGWGADVVIGNHPHVVQRSEEVVSPDGRKGLIVYALGNFISAQRMEADLPRATEESVAIHLTIHRDALGKVTLSDFEGYPLWVRRTREEEGVLFRTLPTDAVLRSAESGLSVDLGTPLTEAEMERVKKADAHVRELIDAPKTVTLVDEETGAIE